MKIEIKFSAIIEADEDTGRDEAFDIADQLAEHIRQKTGMILEVYDVDPVKEY
jgi:hypothetical protein